MNIRDALVHILRPHQLIACWPSVNYPIAGTSLAWECNCGWTSPEAYSTRSDHPEHIVDLMLNYLRNNIGRHPEFFEELTIHQRRLIAGLVAD